MERNIKLLKVFNFLSDFKLYAPIAIIYFSQVTGSYALGLGISAIVMISAAALEVPTGMFSDYIGRRKTIIIGSLCSIAFVLLYSVGTTFEALAIGAIIEGISRAFFSGNNEAFVYDSLSQENQQSKYPQVLGKTNAMFQLALGIASVIGGLISPLSIQLVFFLSLIPQALAFFVSLLLKETKKYSTQSSNIYAHLKDAILQFKNNKKLKNLSIGSMLQFGMGEAMFDFIAVFYSMVWPLWAVGIAKTLNYAGGFLSYHYSGIILKRISPIKFILFRQVYTRTVYITALVFPSVLSPILMTSSSFGYLLLAPDRVTF